MVSRLDSESGPWVPGMAVGRYQLVAPIATGGMAEIWLARQPGVKGFDRVLVIKRLINTFEADNEHVEMFLTEARLAAQLSHPNVVQIFELGEHAGSFFIAMEYVEGETLATIRTTASRRGIEIPYPIAARLTAMAAEGLHYAHTRTSFEGKPLSIIHRDVSPQNLIVTYEGGLKLVDFGIAKVASEATTSGKLKGKIRYMSPEQGRSEQLDERADVFSLGMVLFELVTNTRMFPSLEEFDLLRNAIADETLPRAKGRRPTVPEKIDQIIAKALERKRENRFANAREFQDALEIYLRLYRFDTGSAEISAFMKELFTDRIAERRRLIESAMAGEINPDLMPETLRPTGSIPGSRRAHDSRSRALKTAAAAIVVAGFSLGMILGKPQALPSTLTRPVPTLEAELHIDSDPPGATLAVDSVEQGRAPITLTNLSPGEHQIIATLEHFLPATRMVSLKAGERVRLVVSLGPEPAPVASVSVNLPRPRIAPKRRGLLNLSTKPWAIVYLGRTKLGETPLTDVSLPEGKQLLHLINPEAKIDTLVEVEIRAGETTNKKLRF